MLTIHVDFDHTFHGTGHSGSREWPPAPARLYAALVAGCHNGCHSPQETARMRDALLILEGSPPPVIFEDDAQLPDREWTAGFVAAKPISAKVTATAKELRKMRGKTSAWIAEPVLASRVSFVIEADSEIVDLLDLAAAGVSYLGTASDSCAISVEAGDPDFPSRARRWIPMEDGAGASRTWYPGLGLALDRRFEMQGSLSHDQQRAFVPPVPDHRLSYVRIAARQTAETAFVPLGRDAGMKDTRRIESLLRQVRDLAGEDAFPLVHADPVHGDGSLLGVAVRGLEAARAIQSETGLGLAYDPADRRRWMQIERYFASAPRWRTALPVYAPAQRAVAADLLAYFAQESGVSLLSFERTTPATRGCARSTMPVHPRGFVPYIVQVATETPEVRPQLSDESLMVPVLERDEAAGQGHPPITAPGASQ